MTKPMFRPLLSRILLKCYPKISPMISSSGTGGREIKFPYLFTCMHTADAQGKYSKLAKSVCSIFLHSPL